ncbi:MAG: M48 family metalloprotease [Gammaproteobacteria bacterium]|nr:M48 family metalloprotease [Gammaproteobacteria bacterium]
MTRKVLIWSVFAIFMAGCSVNPVTGESEFMIVSEAQELQMGAQAYAPTQQSQGGSYDVDPALTQYVQNVGNRLAAVSDRQLPYEFVVLNNSVPNAWALPGGKIAVNRGLLTELSSEAELAAVLGHEIVHAAARHSAQQMSRGMLSQVLVVATAVATSDSDYGNLAVGGASVGAQLLNSRYGRGAELESDLYGMRYMSKAGYDPTGAITLQETFVRLSEGQRSDWLNGLFASHPPSPARVTANRETAATLPSGGKLGVEDFHRAMQKTMQLKPAYDAYDEGRKALADKNTSEALVQVNKALDLFSEEAHFHALRGDVRLVEDNYDWAITNYTRAIDRRSNFFYYYLQRGLVRNEIGQTDAAAVDLERSIELMPTAPAYYTLGKIAEQRGDINTAIEHYKVVAKAGGEYGNAAAGELARIELPRNPSAYVKHRCDADANGNLIVSVQNQAGVPVGGVRIAVQYTDNYGRTQQLVKAINGQIASGQIASVNTGLGGYTGSSCPATVIAAHVVQ